MQTPLRLTLRHTDNSTALEARVREHVDRLERLHGEITGCEVVIGAPAGRHLNGEHFDVRINLTLPGGDLHVSNEGGSDIARLDLYAAVHDAFAALERMIKRHNDARHRHREHESIRRQPAPPGE